MSTYLLEQIIKITGDKKSKNFWKKAIKTLGPGIVETELGELKSQILEGTFKNKMYKQITLRRGKKMLEKLEK